MTSKHTLLATTGASPQVVTETLFAIHQGNRKWPDDIYLITTSFGKRKAVAGLLQNGHLQRLCTELRRPMPKFDADHILETPGAEGVAVEDARSLADHEALANFIMTQVRDRTSKKNTTLHASLAGGRKTMTFYIGYAMSLFGRNEDILSHVLVTEGYENIPDFWFPTDAEPYRFLKNRDSQNPLDASKAQVTLAEIPFIRHRRELPLIFLQKDNKEVDFSKLVYLINLANKETPPDNLELIIDTTEKSIAIKDSEKGLEVKFSISPMEFVFYCMMVRFTLDKNSDLLRPSAKGADLTNAQFFIEQFMKIYRLVDLGDINKNIESIETSAEGTILNKRTIKALKGGMKDSWFDSRVTTLRELFSEQIPLGLVRWITPMAIYDDEGNRIPNEKIENSAKKGGYGIAWPVSQIQLR